MIRGLLIKRTVESIRDCFIKLIGIGNDQGFFSHGHIASHGFVIDGNFMVLIEIFFAAFFLDQCFVLHIINS